MWTTIGASTADYSNASASRPLDFIAQLNGSISASILRAQAEGLGRGVQEIEREVELLHQPSEMATVGGWGRLAATALSNVMSASAAKQVTIHLLKSHAESLLALRSLCLGAVRHFESEVVPPVNPTTPVV
jgi:hypothetical protein